jgi:hypothetical protein
MTPKSTYKYSFPKMLHFLCRFFATTTESKHLLRKMR